MRAMVIMSDPHQIEESKTQIIEIRPSDIEGAVTDETKKSTDSLITEQTARNILAALCSGEKVTDDEKNSLEEFVNYNISQMAGNTLDYDLQSVIDGYIYSYLEPRETEPGWTKTETKINNYYHTTNQNNEKIKAEIEAKGIEDGSIKGKYLKANINTKGIIMTVTIIEVTVLLGILIAAIALANR